jgi:hypothetical protein
LKKEVWFFISIFLIFFIHSNAHALDFKVWAEGPPIFTIAKTESINVYIKNTGAVEDDYDITYTVSPTATPHLIQVHLPIDKTKSIKPNETGSVLARVSIQGPISPPDPTISFTATNSTGDSDTSNLITLTTGPPTNLPEFGLIGLIQLLIIASLILVVSYSSRSR